MANALKEMSYNNYLELVETPEGKNVTLNTGAAMGLCRGGAIPTRAPLAWLGLFWAALISIPCVYFWSDPRFIACSIFLAWLGARRSKRSAVSAVWREMKGKGQLTMEQREEMYAILSKNDWMYLPTADETKFG